MANPADASPRTRYGADGLRWLAVGGTAVGFSLIVDLVLLAFSPALRESVNAYFGFSPVSVTALAGPALIGLLILAAIAVLRWWPRTLRGSAVAGLALACLGVGALVLAALVPPVFSAFQEAASIFGANFPRGPADEEAAALAAVLVLSPILVAVLLSCLRLTSWRRIGWCAVALLPLFIYLAMDDSTIEHPSSMEQVSPSFPGASESYAVYIRYGSRHPLGRDFRFQAPNRIYETKGVFDPNGDPEVWTKWLTTNRADLEADWLKLAPVWAWWNELNTYESIGDLTPATADAELVMFGPIRAIAQHAVAIASLQALDGRGDDAFATLLPLFQVSRKLEPYSRTIVRSMVSRVSERLAIGAAAFVLDHAAVSPAIQARFRAALSAGLGSEDGVRRFFVLEYAHWMDLCERRPIGTILVHDGIGSRSYWERPLNCLSPFLYNARHTANVYGNLTADLEGFAERRQLDKLDPQVQTVLNFENRRIKNRMGATLLSLSNPAFGRMMETYWKVEDARSSLIARLAPSTI